jgi:hypothetical protein
MGGNTEHTEGGEGNLFLHVVPILLLSVSGFEEPEQERELACGVVVFAWPRTGSSDSSGVA